MSKNIDKKIEENNSVNKGFSFLGELKNMLKVSNEIFSNYSEVLSDETFGKTNHNKLYAAALVKPFRDLIGAGTKNYSFGGNQ